MATAERTLVRGTRALIGSSIGGHAQDGLMRQLAHGRT